MAVRGSAPAGPALPLCSGTLSRSPSPDSPAHKRSELIVVYEPYGEPLRMYARLGRSGCPAPPRLARGPRALSPDARGGAGREVPAGATWDVTAPRVAPRDSGASPVIYAAGEITADLASNHL